MEQMDVEDGSDVIGAGLEDDRTSASAASLPEESSAAVASEEMERPAASAQRDDQGDPHGERVADVEAKPGPSAADNPGEDAADDDEEGAAAAWLAALPEPLQPTALSMKARKKFCGVESGPVMSGDGKVTENLTLRILKSVRVGVEDLKLASNEAVHARCGLLDDQEGRAFVAADLMGVEIVRGKAANESCKIGEQIDELLRGEKARDKAIRSGIRSRKAKARKKPDAETKLLALDEEQRRKRAEHWDAPVVLDLPDPASVIKVDRVRPPPPPKPDPTESQLRAAVTAAEEAAEAAACDLVAARRLMERSEAVRGELHEERMLAATVGWKLEDEEYEELEGRRAELAAAWERQAALDAELRAEYCDAVLRDHDAKAAAADARAELADCRAAAKREAELKAWLAAGRAADEERREADRLRRHKELMEFYDTMTPDELQRRPADAGPRPQRGAVQGLADAPAPRSRAATCVRPARRPVDVAAAVAAAFAAAVAAG